MRVNAWSFVYPSRNVTLKLMKALRLLNFYLNVILTEQHSLLLSLG
jgi:hypothetical protein